MVFSFATTDAIIRKSLFRYNILKDKAGPYSEDFYRENGAYVQDENISRGILESIKNIWIAML